MTRRRIDFLDYLRIFAFLSVLIGHKFMPQLSAMADGADHHAILRHIARAIMPLCLGGAAGVVVFFLTSGYIIAHVLPRETTVEFLIKRIFRIYPLYMFAVLAQATLEVVVHHAGYPPMSQMLPRLLLVGDFFETGYTLGAVDWTLRIEIVFYCFMAILKLTKLIEKTNLLPIIFLACTVLLCICGPIPNFTEWTKGYTTIYAPFLFIGAITYLIENKLSNRKIGIFIITLIILSFLIEIRKYQPYWATSNFGLLSLLIFFFSCKFQGKIVNTRYTIIASNLTYSIYLFHNWLWQFIEEALGYKNEIKTSHEIIVLIVLLTICYATHRTVERFGIKIGRYVMGVISGKLPNSVSNTPPA